MNRSLLYPVLIALILLLPGTALLPQFVSTAIGQVDPSQEQIEPIPPSNNTNTNQTVPIVSDNNQNYKLI